jgi:hypothetical protein
MRIEEETIRGYRTCARDRRAHGDCPGYVSEEIDVVRETITVTFGDLHGHTSDPYFPITSHTHERLLPASEQDRQCPHCGATASISLEPRHEFPRLSEHSPNELVRRAELERSRDERSAGALDAGERQAIALEKLGRLARGRHRARELREEPSELRPLMASGNGHADEATDWASNLIPSPTRRRRPRGHVSGRHE